MYKCDAKFTKGGCQGHYGGKFDDCLTEGLYSLSLDSMQDEETGSCDSEGHLSLFLFGVSWGADMDGDGTRLALIPPGNYIVFTAPTGSVSLWKYDTRDEALAEMDLWAAAYARYEKGCEQTGHEACEEHDTCQLGGISTH